MCGRDISHVGRHGHNHFPSWAGVTEDGTSKSCTLWETDPNYQQLLGKVTRWRLHNARCSDAQVSALRAECEAAKPGSAAEVEDAGEGKGKGKGKHKDRGSSSDKRKGKGKSKSSS